MMRLFLSKCNLVYISSKLKTENPYQKAKIINLNKSNECQIPQLVQAFSDVKHTNTAFH